MVSIFSLSHCHMSQIGVLGFLFLYEEVQTICAMFSSYLAVPDNTYMAPLCHKELHFAPNLLMGSAQIPIGQRLQFQALDRRQVDARQALVIRQSDATGKRSALHFASQLCSRSPWWDCGEARFVFHNVSYRYTSFHIVSHGWLCVEMCIGNL